MSSFRGGVAQSGPNGPQGQSSPALYNPQLGHPHPHPHSHHHSQHSPALQNDTLVGKALQTMYPTESISSYSSNPSTPVNSPPPLTSQNQPQQHNLHPTPSSGGPATWQQLTPVLNGGANGIQNGAYTPELVTRGLQLVSFFFFAKFFFC